jgi:hypothetical protein
MSDKQREEPREDDRSQLFERPMSRRTVLATTEESYGQPTLTALEASIAATAPPSSNRIWRLIHNRGTQAYIQTPGVRGGDPVSGQTSVAQTLSATASGCDETSEKHGRGGGGRAGRLKVGVATKPALSGFR